MSIAADGADGVMGSVWPLSGCPYSPEDSFILKGAGGRSVQSAGECAGLMGMRCQRTFGGDRIARARAAVNVTKLRWVRLVAARSRPDLDLYSRMRWSTQPRS